ncbi:MAG: helix-turn-helix domain-containing protein [Phycisphaera sp.]|nr:helix-turn-helix domain-containing protein [Phycisphaera sp.]
MATTPTHNDDNDTAVIDHEEEIDVTAQPAMAITRVEQRLLLTDKDAAAMLSVSRSHFRQMVKDWRAPNPVKIGSASRWRTEELTDWVNADTPPRHKWRWPPTRRS